SYKRFPGEVSSTPICTKAICGAVNSRSPLYDITISWTYFIRQHSVAILLESDQEHDDYWPDNPTPSGQRIGPDDFIGTMWGSSPAISSKTTFVSTDNQEKQLSG
ncbi:hypothetical protein, partial [Erwinia amylovora]|uniref:hypothetical protein n=1 Tax=Erwinia amylovora TaxID=552 RepID=UPI00196B9FB0